MKSVDLMGKGLWVAAAILATLVGTAKDATAAHVRVQLAADVDAVAPEASFQIALAFSIDDDWHIYWKNAGDSGMPPQVRWQLPDGFEVGPLRFPVPKRHSQADGLINTNILEGDPVLLATVTAPESFADGGSIKLSADLQWLVCETTCIREEQEVSATLPVRSDASSVKPANQKLFARANASMPTQGPNGKFVTVIPSLADGKLAAGEHFALALKVVVKPGHHIQSNKPLLPGVVATDVFVGPADALFFDPAVFPEPKLRTLPKVGKTSEFGGDITIRIPGEVDTGIGGDRRDIDGLFLCQACNDKTGMCFPPEAVQWSLSIPVGMTAADFSKTPAAPAAEPSAPPAKSGTALAQGTETSDPAPVGDVETFAADTGNGGGGGVFAYLQRFGVAGMLAACFLYGLSINLTPCVLPLLSIKVLGFVQQAHESRRRTLALALSFGAGVILFFVVLGLVASQGTNVLQFPVVVIALSAIVLALALSMLGVFTLQVPQVATNLDARLQKEGLASSFGKGALAPVLGFACTAPFVFAAFGWATQQPPRIAALSFVSMGLGMASPYVLLGANPNWLGFLPKPGQWMITFERIMGFLLLGMVVLLLHPLVVQIGAEGLEWTLVFFVVVGMACWIWGKINFSMESARRWKYRGVAVGLIALGALAIYGWQYSIADAVAYRRAQLARGGTAPVGDFSHGIPWQHWSPEAVEQAVRAGNTVFVDFTAGYCTQCKVNKATVIETPEVRHRMAELGVVPFQGDFSLGDSRIEEELRKFGRAGVPLNLIYRPEEPNRPTVLRPALTLGYVLRLLKEAGPSRSVALANMGS